MKRRLTTYVAETNDEGIVVCVWVDAHGQKSTRPFNPKRDRFDQVTSIEFSGAEPDAIKRWVLQNEL